MSDKLQFVVTPQLKDLDKLKFVGHRSLRQPPALTITNLYNALGASNGCWSPDFVDDVFDRIPVELRCLSSIGEHRADSLHGFARPDIRWPDHENNLLHELKCMVQHEAFQFSVILSAPI